MDAILILVALPAAAWATVRIGASLWTVLHANRQRARVLTKAANESGGEANPLDTVRRADHAAAQALREDYALTGAILAGLGAAALFAGRNAAYGTFAVGLFSAGLLAIVLGFGLALFGAILRLLARPILDRNDGN